MRWLAIGLLTIAARRHGRGCDRARRRIGGVPRGPAERERRLCRAGSSSRRSADGLGRPRSGGGRGEPDRAGAGRRVPARPHDRCVERRGSRVAGGRPRSPGRHDRRRRPRAAAAPPSRCARERDDLDGASPSGPPASPPRRISSRRSWVRRPREEASRGRRAALPTPTTPPPRSRRCGPRVSVALRSVARSSRCAPSRTVTVALRSRRGASRTRSRPPGRSRRSSARARSPASRRFGT